MGWWTDEEVKRILEEVEPVTGWAKEAAPAGPVREQAERARKVVQEALDKIARSKWVLCGVQESALVDEVGDE